MLPQIYNNYSYAEVIDLPDFFNSKLPEIFRVRAIIDAVKLSLSIPSNCILLEVAEGTRIYKVTFLNPGVDKYPFGWLFYVPSNKQVDIYSSDSPYSPLIQYKSKKPVYKGYSALLDKAGLNRIFDKIINAS